MPDLLTSDKWCPQCKVFFSTARENCPTCLADLQVDAADQICPRCGHSNSVGIDSCLKCSALLRRAESSDSFARVVAKGVRLPRPADEVSFSNGANSTLVSLGGSEGLAFAHPSGWLDAYVEVQKNGSRYVTDVSGIPLFRLSQYKAVAHPALSAFTPAGESVGTFIRSGGLRPRIEVRDSTSAPVAFIRPGAEFGWDVVETGGEAFAHLNVTNQYIGDYIDDCWTLKTVAESPLELHALLALLLAAKMLLGGTPQKVNANSDNDAGAWFSVLDGFGSDGGGD